MLYIKIPPGKKVRYKIDLSFVFTNNVNMALKVYLAWQSIKYEGQKLLGVYSSRKLAEKELHVFMDERLKYHWEQTKDSWTSQYGDRLYVEEYIVHNNVHNFVRVNNDDVTGVIVSRCTICSGADSES